MRLESWEAGAKVWLIFVLQDCSPTGPSTVLWALPPSFFADTANLWGHPMYSIICWLWSCLIPVVLLTLSADSLYFNYLLKNVTYLAWDSSTVSPSSDPDLHREWGLDFSIHSWSKDYHLIRFPENFSPLSCSLWPSPSPVLPLSLGTLRFWTPFHLSPQSKEMVRQYPSWGLSILFSFLLIVILPIPILVYCFTHGIPSTCSAGTSLWYPPSPYP